MVGEISSGKVHKPSLNFLLRNHGLDELFHGDVRFKLLLLSFKFFKFGFRSFKDNTRLDCIHEILDFFLVLTKPAFQRREHWTFLGL